MICLDALWCKLFTIKGVLQCRRETANTLPLAATRRLKRRWLRPCSNSTLRLDNGVRAAWRFFLMHPWSLKLEIIRLRSSKITKCQNSQKRRNKSYQILLFQVSYVDCVVVTVLSLSECEEAAGAAVNICGSPECLTREPCGYRRLLGWIACSPVAYGLSWLSLHWDKCGIQTRLWRQRDMLQQGHVVSQSVKFTAFTIQFIIAIP